MTADEKALERGSATQIERPDALRRVDLMAAERKHIDVTESARKTAARIDSAKVDRKLRYRLRRVDVERDLRIRLLNDARELLNGENNARLVIGVHNGNDRRSAGLERLNEFADIDIPV